MKLYGMPKMMSSAMRKLKVLRSDYKISSNVKYPDVGLDYLRWLDI